MFPELSWVALRYRFRSVNNCNTLFQENGEWQLEAGALVLADGGICCIDEFNLMRETDRASIHEAMEQQTVSMAKAGMVCKLSTRCAILAATNPRNLYTMSEPEGPSAMNIGIASPLMSRFDLVYIMRDERNAEWDTRISLHLLSLSKSHARPGQTLANGLWTSERLQSHFAAIRTTHPQFTMEANRVLGEYYKACRSDPMRDQARTTVRLLDSLLRLAQAHARLLFRSEVNVYDAVIVIRLMESTHGFGRILKPFDVIKEELPLGPSREDVQEVYSALNLGEYNEDENHALQSPAVSLDENVPNLRSNAQSSVARSQHQFHEDTPDRLDEILSLDTFDNPQRVSEVPETPATDQSREDIFGEEDESNDNIDQILSFALDEASQRLETSHEPAVQSNKSSFDEQEDSNDNLDTILSLALDNAEEDFATQKSVSEPVQSSGNIQTMSSTDITIRENIEAPKRKPFSFREFDRNRMSLKNTSKKESSPQKVMSVPVVDPAKKNIQSNTAINSGASLNKSLPSTSKGSESVQSNKRNRMLLLSDESSDEAEVDASSIQKSVPKLHSFQHAKQVRRSTEAPFNEDRPMQMDELVVAKNVSMLESSFIYVKIRSLFFFSFFVQFYNLTPNFT